MSIERRRMMMRSRGGVLPYPYKQVEYIESTGIGKEVVNVGVYNVQIGDIIEYKFVPITFGGGLWIGHWEPTPRFYVSNYSLANYSVSYNFSMQYATALGRILSTNVEHNIKIDNSAGILYLDGEDVSHFTPVNWSTNQGYTVAGNEHQRTISYKHYRNGELLHNLIPCYDSTDPTRHTAGLYDIVNNQFYGNSGTGYFIVGPDV